MTPATSTFPRFSIFMLCFFICLLALYPQQKVMAQFQNLYGSGTYSYFNRVIPAGNAYYVLGNDNGMATVSLINGSGTCQWTKTLSIGSAWTDGILVPSTGHLMMVGFTLPLNSSNKSLIGEVTAAGNLCVNQLDGPGTEALGRIAANSNGTYSAVGFHTTPSSLQDVVVFNFSPGCTLNSTQQFFSAASDGFGNDIEVLPNNDFLVGGITGGSGVIYQMDANANFVNGVQGPSQFNYSDLQLSANGDLLAIANSTAGGAPRMMRFDAFLLPVWEVEVLGLNTLDQVLEGGSGTIYAMGTKTIAGLNRSVILKMIQSGGSPSLVWAKYLGNTETDYVGGAIALTATGGLSFVDGRDGHPSGFGQMDGFLAVTDADLTSSCTFMTDVAINTVSTLFDGPQAPPLFPSETPVITAVPNTQIDCMQATACGAPCEASFNITYVDNCGHIQVTNTSTGQGPLTYQWCNGATTANLDLQLPCGEHLICVTVFCADNTTSTASQTITISDNIPPTINCPQDMSFTAFHPDCSIPVFNIHSLGANDNCGVPTVDYVISGVTSGSGIGDASGTVFNAGTSTVTYTATDWCQNTASCSFDITVACDTCSCLGFQNMEFYNFLNQPDLAQPVIVHPFYYPVLLPMDFTGFNGCCSALIRSACKVSTIPSWLLAADRHCFPARW